ncbi:hypothetical protein BC829DRAFT_419138 [Chytridium lagenaria]|nr:hypothetical protein BC829DRAFT_419138 [Chytridium lagenaria]
MYLKTLFWLLPYAIARLSNHFIGGIGCKGWGEAGQGHPGLSMYLTKGVPIGSPDHMAVLALQVPFAVMANRVLLNISSEIPVLKKHLGHLGLADLKQQRNLLGNKVFHKNPFHYIQRIMPKQTNHEGVPPANPLTRCCRGISNYGRKVMQTDQYSIYAKPASANKIAQN